MKVFKKVLVSSVLGLGLSAVAGTAIFGATLGMCGAALGLFYVVGG